MEPLDLREAFTQEKADDSNKMHNNQFSPNNDIGNHWGFTGEDFAEEYFPSGCCLQHYTNTDTSKMQNTIEEAQLEGSRKKIHLLREICQMEQNT